MQFDKIESDVKEVLEVVVRDWNAGFSGSNLSSQVSKRGAGYEPAPPLCVYVPESVNAMRIRTVHLWQGTVPQNVIHCESGC